MSFAELMNNSAFSAFRTRDDVGEQLRMVLSRYHVEPLSRWSELLELTDAVFSGMLEVKDMPELLAQAFGLDERNAWRMARDLVAVQILPMHDVVPGLAEQIDAWRASHSEKAEEPRTYEDYAETLGGRVGFSLSGQHTRRLANHLAAYMKGAKTKEQTSTLMQRPIVIGGLGLTADQAIILLQFADENKGKLTLIDEAVGEEKAVSTAVDMTNTVVIPSPSTSLRANSAEGSLTVAPSHALSTETPIAAKPPERKNVGAGHAQPTHNIPPTHEDAAEIAAHKKKMAKAQISIPGDASLEAAVDAAVALAAPTLAKARVAKKTFADIARMAIKGVRDPYQTRAIIERDCGVTGEPVLELIEAVMQGMETYNVRDVRRETLDMRAPTAHSSSLTSDADVLDKRFAAVAGKVPTSSVEPVMPEARVSAARTKNEELHEQSAKIDAGKLAAAAASTKPKPVKALLTVGSVPPSLPGEMPMVTDVQFTPHLVGPVEELGTMSPAEFRRLSGNADEAARKVEDVLQALESTSFEERIRGVQAWRQSPMHRLYTTMATEALNNGIALAEVASRRRNKGEETLTPAELRAVANINAAIRF